MIVRLRSVTSVVNTTFKLQNLAVGQCPRLDQ
jgi:hypothetical protein